MKNTLTKAERLCSKKWKEELHNSGTSFRIYPLKVAYLEHHFETASPVSVLFSVPKHLFKLAHDRNLLKRRMREAYRKNKHSLVQLCCEHQKKLFIAFYFSVKKEESYQVIEKSAIKSMSRIEKIVSTPNNTHPDDK